MNNLALRLVHFKQAGAIFDLEDRYARDRGVRGPHPRPIGELGFELRGTVTGGVLQPFAHPRQLEVSRNPGGYHVFFDRFRAPDGRRYQESLPEATYRLRITSPFYRIHEDDVQLPNPSGAIPIELEPGYAYPFPIGVGANRGGATLLRGTVHATDGRGVADLGVEVAGRSNRYRTDGTGQWLLVFPDDEPAGNVTVRFDWPGGGSVDVPAVAIVPGQSSNLFQAGLRGQVLSDAGLALSGARITVSGYGGESVSGPDGIWFYYFELNQGADTVNVTAELSDGTTRTRYNVPVQPRAVVVVPGFRFN